MVSCLAKPLTYQSESLRAVALGIGELDTVSDVNMLRFYLDDILSGGASMITRSGLRRLIKNGYIRATHQAGQRYQLTPLGESIVGGGR